MWADFRRTEDKTQNEEVGTIKTKKKSMHRSTDPHFNLHNKQTDLRTPKSKASKEQYMSPEWEKKKAIFLRVIC